MFKFTIRGTVYTARSLAGISAAYCKARDDSGEGASTFPTPDIQWNEEGVARLSYNGRIWPLVDWVAGLAPLYDPAADPVPDMLAACHKVANNWQDLHHKDLMQVRAAIAKAESTLT